MQETQVQSLIQEEPLKKEMAIDSSILPRILSTGVWTEEPGVVQSMWLQRVGRDLATEQQHVYMSN